MICKAALRTACPDGVDVYLTCGRPYFEMPYSTILTNLPQNDYRWADFRNKTNTEAPKSVSVQPFLIKKQRIDGGLYKFRNYMDKFPESHEAPFRVVAGRPNYLTQEDRCRRDLKYPSSIFRIYLKVKK